MAKFEEVTHIFKVADGLSLAIDVLKPPSTDQTAPVLLHFHGGFLVDALSSLSARIPLMTFYFTGNRAENHIPAALAYQRLP